MDGNEQRPRCECHECTQARRSGLAQSLTQGAPVIVYDPKNADTLRKNLELVGQEATSAERSRCLKIVENVLHAHETRDVYGIETLPATPPAISGWREACEHIKRFILAG